ncbi:DNA repair protein RAD51 homolog 3-like [Penaeus indicus]|uniref:DNA repair protein RAD51 homolog 3-like n=1 Tax=Penaeus indicus TaxID=29960 RepID=UPI00300C0C63
MSTRRPLSSLGLAVPVVARLLDSDFLYDDDVQDLKPTELSSATGLTLKESAEVLRLAASVNAEQPVTVMQMIEDESEVCHVVTFCEALDDMLGGGIPLRAITEVSGTPGIGKTQLCLQACVSVQLPESVGGVGGEALFVDTEGSFTVGRLKDMAGHAVEHVQNIAGDEIDVSSFTIESILKGVHYFRCHSYIEVLAVIRHLPVFLQSHPRLKLFIIDSIAFHFRHDFPDMMARTGLLCRITQQLIQQATKFNMAVIVTNQMTTRIESGGSQLVAALGETWGHCPTMRLTLHWSGRVRVASLTKAPHRNNASVQYQITKAGIRDITPFMTDTSTPMIMDSPDRKKRKLNT